MTNETTHPLASPVVVDYRDLQDPCANLHSQLEHAFGAPSSLGLVVIANIPDFERHKQGVLSLSHALISLPEEYLQAELEDATSLFNAGYSRGKEKLGDTLDVSKASFYFNPIADDPGNPELRKAYPTSYPRNKWPTEKLPELEPACKTMGRLMKHVVVMLARHLDSYCATKISSYSPSLLYDALLTSDKIKGRLLYYFPTTAESQDSWIGWHKDSGFLTALAGDLYLNHATGTIVNQVPDKAGLHIQTRDGLVVKVEIPSDCMAIQLGEAMQILSGGVLAATPHCVRGCPGEARTSLPVFVDAPPTYQLQLPSTATRGNVLRHDSPKIPSLASRWTEDGMAFGDFLMKTFETYYEWNTKSQENDS
jgi:isopenicillin N synthase-like dioxygenase